MLKQERVPVPMKIWIVFGVRTLGGLLGTSWRNETLMIKFQ